MTSVCHVHSLIPRCRQCRLIRSKNIGKQEKRSLKHTTPLFKMYGNRTKWRSRDSVVPPLVEAFSLREKAWLREAKLATGLATGRGPGSVTSSQNVRNLLDFQISAEISSRRFLCGLRRRALDFISILLITYI